MGSGNEGVGRGQPIRPDLGVMFGPGNTLHAQGRPRSFLDSYAA